MVSGDRMGSRGVVCDDNPLLLTLGQFIVNGAG